MVLGLLFTIATFPGVILHEYAHKLACEKTGLKVSKVCYFRFGNPAGYVIHEKPETFYQAFTTAVAPFFLNTLVAIITYLIALPIRLDYLRYILIWLGMSFASHAFPSKGDAKTLLQFVKDKGALIKLLALPVIALIYVGSVLSIFWFDLFYAAVLLQATLKLLHVSGLTWARI